MDSDRMHEKGALVSQMLRSQFHGNTQPRDEAGVLQPLDIDRTAAQNCSRSPCITSSASCSVDMPFEPCRDVA
jgi:hypothetical protein